MRILLTGAFGNIGSSTLRELVRREHTVRCFDIQTPRTQRVAQQFQGLPNVEVVWGDLRREEQVVAAVEDREIIIHFGAILPPEVDKNPERAQDVNVNGTRRLIEAAKRQAQPPRFLLASSLDVFGYTQDKEPPRKVTDPIQATDNYTTHKIACEEMLRASGLEWAIFRFADVPPLAARQPDPIMYRIPLDTRFEMIHTHDAGLAVANGIERTIWGKIWLIGGGSSCQIRYRDYLRASLERAGVGMLPESAFGNEPYCTDWLDSSESQELLQYQRHSFAEIMNDLEAPPAPVVKLVMPLVRPLVQRSLLKLSPYWPPKAAASKE